MESIVYHSARNVRASGLKRPYFGTGVPFHKKVLGSKSVTSNGCYKTVYSGFVDSCVSSCSA